jgi:hypothetical protein
LAPRRRRESRPLDQLSPRVEQILVLHDFDISGFTILGTLASDSRRFRFSNKSIAMIDIGLRLADVEALDLQSEPVSVSGKWRSRARTLEQYGATPEEIAFLRAQRVELNAMTSRQFVDHLARCGRGHAGSQHARARHARMDRA